MCEDKGKEVKIMNLNLLNWIDLFTWLKQPVVHLKNPDSITVSIGFSTKQSKISVVAGDLPKVNRMPT